MSDAIHRLTIHSCNSYACWLEAFFRGEPTERLDSPHCCVELVDDFYPKGCREKNKQWCRQILKAAAKRGWPPTIRNRDLKIPRDLPEEVPHLRVDLEGVPSVFVCIEKILD
jgi:hypothetical protein